MDMSAPEGLIEHFSKLEDPRIDRNAVTDTSECGLERLTLHRSGGSSLRTSRRRCHPGGGRRVRRRRPERRKLDRP